MGWREFLVNEASRGDSGNPLMSWLMLTDGYRAVGSVRVSPHKAETLLLVLLFSLRMEQDQLERPDQGDCKVLRIWSQKN